MSKKDFEIKKILIIEDNMLNRKLMEMVVGKSGHKAISLSCGNHAIETIREERPDLIFLDIKLNEISGVEIGKKIKSDPELKSIPIIVITAFIAEVEKRNISRETQCDHYLTKPFLPDTLINIISEYFPIKEYQ